MTEAEIEAAIKSQHGVDAIVWQVGNLTCIEIGRSTVVRKDWRDAMAEHLKRGDLVEMEISDAPASVMVERKDPPVRRTTEDARDAEMQALRDRVKELEAREPEIVERVVIRDAPFVSPETTKLSDFEDVEGEDHDHFVDLFESADQEAEKERLRQRYKTLHHMLVDQSGGLPDLTDSERVELEDLQRRNKASRNWLSVDI